MSREPDDPANRDRPRPPIYETAFSRAIELNQLSGQFYELAHDQIINKRVLQSSLRSFLCTAFLAETGLRAEESMCVIEDKGDTYRFFFKPAPLTAKATVTGPNPYLERIAALEHQNLELHKRLAKVARERDDAREALEKRKADR